MTGYELALYIHFLSLLLATVAAALSTFAALQLRSATEAADVARWGAFIEKAVRAFPVSVLGLVGSGAYMTQDAWSWSTPWIDAALAGLALIVALGAGVEASRGRALEQEVRSAGMSDRAHRLLRDPASWSAKMTTLTLMLAVVWVMTAKPSWPGAIAALAGAVAGGVGLAVPFWRASRSWGQAGFETLGAELDPALRKE